MPSGGKRSTSWEKGKSRGRGRPLGSKDTIPRSVKGSIKRIFEEVATDNPELIRKAIEDGLKARAPKSAPYLTLAAAYVDGKPRDTVAVENADGTPVVFTLVLKEGAGADDL